MTKHFVLSPFFRIFARKLAVLDRTFHSHITLPSIFVVILMAALGVFLFWQRNGLAALLGFAVFAVCAIEVDRLVHSEYVVTDDFRLVVRRGRLARARVIPMSDIVEVKELKMFFGMGSYVLVRYGASRYATFQPANPHSLVEDIEKKLDQLTDESRKQTNEDI